MKITYDSDLDSLMIILKKDQEDYYEEILPGFNLEFNKDKELIGIELFNASSVFKKQILAPYRIYGEQEIERFVKGDKIPASLIKKVQRDLNHPTK